MQFFLQGSQVVHSIYRPLDDLEELVAAEKAAIERLRAKRLQDLSPNERENNAQVAK